HAVEEECAAGAVGHGGVEAEVQQFVPHLESMSSADLGQVVTERYGLIDQPIVAVADEAPQPAVAVAVGTRGAELRHQIPGDIGNAELLGPVLTGGIGELVVAAPVVSNASVVDHGRADHPRLAY